MMFILLVVLALCLAALIIGTRRLRAAQT